MRAYSKLLGSIFLLILMPGFTSCGSESELKTDAGQNQDCRPGVDKDYCADDGSFMVCQPLSAMYIAMGVCRMEHGVSSVFYDSCTGPGDDRINEACRVIGEDHIQIDYICTKTDNGEYFLKEVPVDCDGGCYRKSRDSIVDICRHPGDSCYEPDVVGCNRGDLVYCARLSRFSSESRIYRNPCGENMRCIMENGDSFCHYRCDENTTETNVCIPERNSLLPDMKCLDYMGEMYFQNGSAPDSVSELVLSQDPMNMVCVDNNFVSTNAFSSCDPEQYEPICLGNTGLACSYMNDHYVVNPLPCGYDKCAVVDDNVLCLPSCVKEGERLSAFNKYYQTSDSVNNFTEFVCRKFEDGSLYYYPEKKYICNDELNYPDENGLFNHECQNPAE